MTELLPEMVATTDKALHEPRQIDTTFTPHPLSVYLFFDTFIILLLYFPF